jgi:hypothetical protein
LGELMTFVERDPDHHIRGVRYSYCVDLACGTSRGVQSSSPFDPLNWSSKDGHRSVATLTLVPGKDVRVRQVRHGLHECSYCIWSYMNEYSLRSGSGPLGAKVYCCLVRFVSAPVLGLQVRVRVPVPVLVPVLLLYKTTAVCFPGSPQLGQCSVPMLRGRGKRSGVTEQHMPCSMNLQRTSL